MRSVCYPVTFALGLSMLLGGVALVAAEADPQGSYSAILKQLAAEAPANQEWITVGDILVKRSMAEKGAFQGATWRGGVVPICFSATTPAQRTTILASISGWTEGTGVRFIEDCELADRINIVLDPASLPVYACGSSPVGRQGLQQPLNLRSSSLTSDPGCALHEMGHALGLLHEHQRPDRDSYVEILPQNICNATPEQIEGNFGVDDGNTYGLPYDFQSVMHYSSTALGCVVGGTPQQTIRTRTGVTCGSPATSATCDAQMGRRFPASIQDKAAMAIRYPAGAPYCYAKFIPSISADTGSPTLTWVSGNGQLEVAQSSGPLFLSATGTQAYGPFSAGFYGLDFAVRNMAGSSSTCFARFTVHPPGAPSCNATFNPPSIAPGGTTTLAWNSQGGQLEAQFVIPSILLAPTASSLLTNPSPGTYRFTVRNAQNETSTCAATLSAASSSVPLDEPSASRVTLPAPIPANASCPAGFFIATVTDGPGTGISTGAFGMELLLDDPGTRVLAGGLNFGGLIDAGQVGFAGFTIANAANESQRLTLNLTGSPASSTSAIFPVRINISRRTATSTTPIYEITSNISMAAPFITNLDLSPGFYQATVSPLTGTIGGSPEGQFFFSLTTSYINRAGGGFQGGAVVGGYHATHPFGGVSGFAAFCLATPHTASVRVVSQPTYGPTGARDLRLRIQDAQQATIISVPSG